MSHPAFTLHSSRGASSHWPVRISRSIEGRRLSWPVSGYYTPNRDGMPTQTVTHRSILTDRWCDGRGSNARPFESQVRRPAYRLPSHLKLIERRLCSSYVMSSLSVSAMMSCARTRDPLQSNDPLQLLRPT